MKTHLFIILILLSSYFISSCNFDEQRQIDLDLPVSFELVNNTNEIITIKSIYNSIDALTGFVFRGEKILTGKSFKFKISEANFKAISSGKYYIDGSCESNSKWLIKGDQLNKKIITNETEWKIIVTIINCDE